MTEKQAIEKIIQALILLDAPDEVLDPLVSYYFSKQRVEGFQSRYGKLSTKQFRKWLDK